jgi:hypothetical protein
VSGQIARPRWASPHHIRSQIAREALSGACWTRANSHSWAREGHSP